MATVKGKGNGMVDVVVATQAADNVAAAVQEKFQALRDDLAKLDAEIERLTGIRDLMRGQFGQMAGGGAQPKRRRGRPPGSKNSARGRARRVGRPRNSAGIAVAASDVLKFYKANPSATVGAARAAHGNQPVSPAIKELVAAEKLVVVGKSNKAGTKYRAV
jgi:hypothetical protein